ncbi:hypothetical protein JCM3770_001508 [Rhodotorula araucariae]
MPSAAPPPLPTLSGAASESPRLPPLPFLAPLSTNTFSSSSASVHRPGPHIDVDDEANSPRLLQMSAGSDAVSRASTATSTASAATARGGDAASTPPSSVESLAPAPGSPAKPSALLEEVAGLALGERERASMVPPLDTPAALLAALEFDVPLGLVAGQALEVHAPAVAEDEVAVEGCGCDVPESLALYDDSDGVAEGGDDALAAEAEALLLSAQAHLSSPPFLSTTAAGKRPSLPLPALPGGMAARGSFSRSVFVEEGLAPLPEHHVAEAGEGGVLGVSDAADDPAPERARRLAKALLRRKRSTADKKQRAPFERFQMPSVEDLEQAAACELVGEGGNVVTFGELIKARGERRTVVIFLRHAWCGLCAQYVEALNRATVNLVSLSTSSFIQLGEGRQPGPRIPPLYIVLINSGSPALISSYRARMATPFPLYSQRSRTLYKALGMTKKTWDMGKDSEKGSYIVKSKLANVTSSISAGVALRGYPGSQTQLGGEFVFEPSPVDGSIKCLYASRMHTTRAHAEIEDVFAAAGVELNAEDAASVYGDLGT